MTVDQAEANYTRGGGRGTEEGIFSNVKRLAVLFECNKNISKHLPFYLEKLLFGSFQKGMLGEIFFACGSLVIYFRWGGAPLLRRTKCVETAAKVG